MEQREDEGRQDPRGPGFFLVLSLLYSLLIRQALFCKEGSLFMAMLNDCNFIGRVGKQPDFQKPEKGNSYLRFSLAVDQGKDQQGKEKEAMWLHIVCFGKLAVLMAGKLEQGIQV